jgi:enamine deaminase RidA (YjgF/YER057c/UK114 family)
MDVERLRPKNVIDTVGTMQYAQAVRAGNLLFVSGQTGWGADMSVPSDYEEECRAAFRNLEAVLAEAGCGFADVVDVTSFHTPDTDTATFWRVRNEFFADPWPAWTLIRDIGLALPTLHVEIKVTAVIPS